MIEAYFLKNRTKSNKILQLICNDRRSDIGLIQNIVPFRILSKNENIKLNIFT